MSSLLQPAEERLHLCLSYNLPYNQPHLDPARRLAVPLGPLCWGRSLWFRGALEFARGFSVVVRRAMAALLTACTAVFVRHFGFVDWSAVLVWFVHTARAGTAVLRC